MSRETVIRLVLLSAFFSAVVYAVATFLITGIFAYGCDDVFRGLLSNMEPSQIVQVKPQMDKAVSSGCIALAQFTQQALGVYCVIGGILLAFAHWGLWHYFWDYLKKNTADKGESLGL
jgi:hypothetical protein